VDTSSTTHKGIDLFFVDIPENLPVPNISTDVLAWNKLYDSYYKYFLHLQNLTSMIMVSLSLSIVRVPVFLVLFSIGHTLTTSTSPKIGLV
jgi:hypothetical protein